MPAERIQTAAQLAALTRRLRISPDWHEPDQQDVTARVHGDRLDNAGSWGSAILGAGGELWVEVLQDGGPVAEVNLASLLSWAAEAGHEGR